MATKTARKTGKTLTNATLAGNAYRSLTTPEKKALPTCSASDCDNLAHLADENGELFCSETCLDKMSPVATTATTEPVSALADPSQPVDLATGEPVSETAAAESDTPSTTKALPVKPVIVKNSYTIKIEIYNYSTTPLATVEGENEAKTALVQAAKSDALKAQGLVAGGHRDTGYAVTRKGLVIGELYITDTETGEKALTETPKSLRSEILAVKRAALDTAMKNFIETPNGMTTLDLNGQMLIWENAKRELSAAIPPVAELEPLSEAA